MNAQGQWIKLTTDWDQSAWVAEMSPEARLCWVLLLCHAKPNKGTFSTPIKVRWCFYHGVSEGAFDEMVAAAVAHGAMECNGVWTITSYSDYQDYSTDRVRAFRERQRDAEADETPCNVSSVPAVSVTFETIEEKRREEKREERNDKRFSKPSEEDLAAEFERRGYPKSQAQRLAVKFIAHYESKGWKVGTATMKSWTAAVTTWVERDPPPAKPGAHDPDRDERKLRGAR